MNEKLLNNFFYLTIGTEIIKFSARKNIRKFLNEYRKI